MSVVDLEELKRRILIEFQAFGLGNGPYVMEGGFQEYRAGFTQAQSEFVLESVVEEAKTWWVRGYHRALAEDNANLAKNAGPAWRPIRSAGTRGPAIKSYSQGRMVVNFEYTDTKDRKRFNYHVPLFPRGLALHPPVPTAPAPALHGWELVNESWVKRSSPAAPPPVVSEPVASGPVVNMWASPRKWS